MRLTILAVSLLATSPAVALDMPETLLGTWETELANCANPTPTTGAQLTFEPEQISILFHETEGGSCQVSSVEQDGQTFTILASCRSEEGPYEEPAPLALTLDTSGSALTFEDEVYQRCPLSL